MTLTDTDLDRLLGVAQLATDQQLGEPRVRAAVAAVAEEAACVGTLVRGVQVAQARRNRRTRRAVLAGAVASAVVLAGGGAAAAGWVDLHTGFFGSPRDTEGDTSEYLDTRSPEIPGLLRDYAKQTPLAPGATLDPLMESIAANPGLQQEAGLRGSVALFSACTWEIHWLAAFRSGDKAAQEQALVVLRQIPTWPALVAVDGDRVAHDASLRAEAAAGGDPAPLERNVATNCGSAR
jgi:hypothetical protein